MLPQILLFLSLTADGAGNALRAWDALAAARLEAQVQRIRRAGHPASLEELNARYHRPPKGPNAAPIYLAAFARLDAIGDQARELERGLPIVGERELPRPGQSLDPATVAALRGWLALHRDALALLHKAAGVRECRFPLDLTKGFALEVPHLARMRQAVRLLALEAIEAASRGDGKAVAGAMVAALRASRALRSEPILMSALVRTACDSITVETLQWCLGVTRPPGPALLPVQRLLAAEATENFILDAMIGERCFGIGAWKQLEKDAGRDLAAALGGGLRAPLGLGLIPRALWNTDKAFYLRMMNDYVDALSLPAPRRYTEAALVGRNLQERVPRWCLLSRMLLPALERVFQVAQRNAARCSTAAVAVACLRYRARKGRFPDDLGHLVPEFIEAVPLDPFNGKPLRYRKRRGGIVVYSVGKNLRDDGGRMKDRRGPDIAFRIVPRRASF